MSLKNDFDFGFTFEDSEETKSEKEELLNKIRTLEDKLQEAENLILPLLYNLQMNPEKPTIHWPNRKEIIQKQIEKILQVTRYYEK